jgi:hypothetical protein
METWLVVALVVVALFAGAAVTRMLMWRGSHSSSTSLDARIAGYSIWQWDGTTWKPHSTTTVKPGHVAPQTPGPFVGYTVRVIAKRP